MGGRGPEPVAVHRRIGQNCSVCSRYIGIVFYYTILFRIRSYMVYTVDPIEGDLFSIDDLILRVCDQLGEFFADIYLSPAVHFVQPESGKSDSLKW
jgi:hypothetical protein